MEVINLDLEKNDHKTLNMSTDSSPGSGNLNVVRNNESFRYLDLLMNKSKMSGDGTTSPKQLKNLNMILLKKQNQ